MGTKLEYAITLLATSQNSSSISVHCMDDLEYLQTRGLEKNLQVSGIDKFGSSMDKMPGKHNIDFIKKTMQLHEDIFKQQVSFNFKNISECMFCSDQRVTTFYHHYFPGNSFLLKTLTPGYCYIFIILSQT
jgi:hypothetical protein